jgi:hypothetical protein
MISSNGGPSKYEQCEQNRHVDENANHPLTIQILHSSIPREKIDKGRKRGGTYNYRLRPSLVHEDSYPTYNETHCSQD